MPAPLCCCKERDEECKNVHPELASDDFEDPFEGTVYENFFGNVNIADQVSGGMLHFDDPNGGNPYGWQRYFNVTTARNRTLVYRVRLGDGTPESGGFSTGPLELWLGSSAATSGSELWGFRTSNVGWALHYNYSPGQSPLIFLTAPRSNVLLEWRYYADATDWVHEWWIDGARRYEHRVALTEFGLYPCRWNNRFTFQAGPMLPVDEDAYTVLDYTMSVQ